MISLTSYSEKLKPEVEKVFLELRENAKSIIDYSESIEKAREALAAAVASKTTMYSKLLLSDLCSFLTKQALELTFFDKVSRKNKFYEADLKRKISQKYSFDTSLIQMHYKETNRLHTSLTASAGTVALGAILIGALSPANFFLPIAAVVAISVAAYCAAYFKLTPAANKAGFNRAVERYLSEIQHEFMKWFQEAEKYYAVCLNELVDQIRKEENNG